MYLYPIKRKFIKFFCLFISYLKCVHVCIYFPYNIFPFVEWFRPLYVTFLYPFVNFYCVIFCGWTQQWEYIKSYCLFVYYYYYYYYYYWITNVLYPSRSIYSEMQNWISGIDQVVSSSIFSGLMKHSYWKSIIKNNDGYWAEPLQRFGFLKIVENAHLKRSFSSQFRH